MDPLRIGARLLSRGMRRSNPALTLVGAALAAYAVAKWLDRPERELLYARKLKRGQSIKIGVADPQPSR